MTPIREALQRLVREGFVQAIPRFGYTVSLITISGVGEIFELRAILESAAARLAAIKGSEEQLKAIVEAANFTYIYKDRQSYSNFLARNADFHRSIAVAAGNQRLVDAISRVFDELTRVFHLGLDLKDSAEEMADEHRALAAALLDRDPDQAGRTVQSQITRSQQRVLEAILGGVRSELSKTFNQTVQVHPPGSRS
ncbi:MAG: GntR family transcriptional regulator [Ardenticatenaceae bacterium]|nr:GntR family transcriptional regulator [Ardenticatenaceae bacterium]